MTNQGYAQAGDIDRSRIISGPIPEALRIGAAEPGSPIVDLAAMLRRTERMGRAAAPWAGMRGVARLLPFKTNACEKAFVAQDSPEFPAHL